MKILVSCLESSANLHLEEVLKHIEEYELLGIFDKKFGDPLYSSSDFGIMGFIDFFRVYKKGKKAVEEMAELAREADAVLLIDSPAFNIPLAKKIKELGIKTKVFYYILPQVWAWKAKRVKEVEAVCDKLFAILPFEEKYWNKAEYVGNPLMDEITEQKSELLKNGKTAFLAGSRKSEITRLMPIFRELAKEIDGEKTLVIPEFFLKEDIEKVYGDISAFNISFNAKDTIYTSEQAIICSGTATLEAAIIGTPFVLVYKAKSLDFFLGKLFVKLPFVGLANIIMYFAKEKPIHTELLQSQVTKENILSSLKSLDRDLFLRNVHTLRSKLAKRNSSICVATAINAASRNLSN